jgi:spore coat protein U-like protein
MTVFSASSTCLSLPVSSAMAPALPVQTAVRPQETTVGGMRKLLILIFTSALTVCCMAMPAAAAIACTISMTNTAFGSINVLPGSAIDTTSTATITCSGATPPGTSYRFCTDIRSGADASGNQRQMASGANRLNFDLYKDAARTVAWGNYTNNFLGGGSQNDFTSNGSSNISGTITLYARVPGSQQTAIPASYSETMSSGTSNDLQYGSKSNQGSCPTGGSTSAYSFNVTATVVTSCNVSATTHNFGSPGILSSNVDATSTVTAQCTNTTPYNIGLDAGTGTGATVAVRKMTSGGATINYSLYTNVGRTTVWGNTVGTNTVGGTGSGVAQNVTAFGRVPSQTTPAPATYSDTIVATVTY